MSATHSAQMQGMRIYQASVVDLEHTLLTGRLAIEEGALLRAILERTANARTVLSDLPEVVAQVVPHERMQVMNGDFLRQRRSTVAVAPIYSPADSDAVVQPHHADFPLTDPGIKNATLAELTLKILILWWKGRDSNPRPRHYECHSPQESGVETRAYNTCSR